MLHTLKRGTVFLDYICCFLNPFMSSAQLVNLLVVSILLLLWNTIHVVELNTLLHVPLILLLYLLYKSVRECFREGCKVRKLIQFKLLDTSTSRVIEATLLGFHVLP